MAKQSNDSFSMAAEIREILTKNPGLKGSEVLAALQKKFPNRSINRSSMMVAFSQARKQLGLKVKGRKVVRKIKRANRANRNDRVPVVASSPQPNYDALISAKKLLQDAGSLEAAAQAISIVHDLQK